jgi:ABC-type multidrug transport system fused ATPase/permease subunit
VFARSGEAVTKRLRSKAFRAILRQEIAFFDNEKHSTGALCTRLATEASAVQGASGVRLGLILEHLFSVGVGILIAFAYSWQLTLLIIVFLPLILFGGILQIRLTARFARKDKQILEDGGKVCEYFVRFLCFSNYSVAGGYGSYSKHSNSGSIDKRNSFLSSIFSNTRHCLSVLLHVFPNYEKDAFIHLSCRSSLKRIHISSIVFSVASAIFYFAIAAFISLSAYLVDKGTITFESVLM